MTAPSFLQTLRTTVAQFQAAHPEREGELARAHALILQGMVVPSDDPTTAHVLSSDGAKSYTVNGACDCSAGQHGKACKHMHAWKLYQYITRKVGEQTAPRTLEAPQGLGEAPASVNFRAMLRGFDVQITLRDTTEAALLVRLDALLKRSDLKPLPKPQPKSTWKGRQYQGR
jgi:hypothetical protein